MYLDQLSASRRQVKEAYALLNAARMNLQGAKRIHEVIKLDMVLLDVRTVQVWLGDDSSTDPQPL
jgi:hypothetical protein